MEDIRARLKAAELTRAQRMCLALYWYDGMRQEEISARLRMSQQAVATHLSKGQASLAAVGVQPHRRRGLFKPMVLRRPPTWLDQLGPEDLKAVW